MDIESVAEEVRELFRLHQENNKAEIFSSLIFDCNSHITDHHQVDSWRFQPEILTFILYLCMPNQKFIGQLLSPSVKKGISQPAVSKRLHRAVEIIAEKYDCPAAELHRELEEAKQRKIYDKKGERR